MTSSVDTGGVFQDLQEGEFSLRLVRRARVSSVEIKRRCSLRSRVGALEEAPGVIVHRQVEPRVGGANALSNATSGTVVGSEAGQRRKTVQRAAFVDRDRGRGCAFFISPQLSYILSPVHGAPEMVVSAVVAVMGQRHWRRFEIVNRSSMVEISQNRSRRVVAHRLCNCLTPSAQLRCAW